MLKSGFGMLRWRAVAFLLTAWIAGCGSSREAKKLPIGNVESPKPGESLKGSVRIAGWALAEQGIDRVDVYWDDVLVASGGTGASRPDVQAVYPTYREAANSGFDFTANASSLAPGPHQLTVQARSKDDAVRELYRSPQTVTP
jgi:hypothetical protein